MRPTSSRRGFTLLELLIAMTFVVLLATGITLSVTTALRVWKMTLRQNELHQEARAIMEVLARDLRGGYLGKSRDAGFFVGGWTGETGATATDQTAATSVVTTAPVDPLYLTSESSTAGETALLPEEMQKEWDQTVERPISDLLAVRWEWREEAGGQEAQPAGLYRSTAVVLTRDPEAQPVDQYGVELGGISTELVSEAVKSLKFRYYDGSAWVDSWDSRQQQNTLPKQVAIELELRDPSEVATERARGVSNAASPNERTYVFRNIITLAMR